MEGGSREDERRRKPKVGEFEEKNRSFLGKALRF